MSQYHVASVTLALTVGILACAEPTPRMSVQDEIFLGDAPALMADGLQPEGEYTLTVNVQDALQRS